MSSFALKAAFTAAVEQLGMSASVTVTIIDGQVLLQVEASVTAAFVQPGMSAGVTCLVCHEKQGVHQPWHA
jgi:hypothetical protein